MAKAKPGQVNYGSGGVGTTPHMSGELFQAMAGIKLVHVAYRGEAPGHQRSARRADPVHVLQPVRHRRQRPRRAVARAGRHQRQARRPPLPDVPTLAEAGLPGFDAATWFALVAPAGTPRDVRERLNAEVKRALALPDVRQRFDDLGMTADGPHAGERRRLYQVRDRQMDQGDQGRRHQGAGLGGAMMTRAMITRAMITRRRLLQLSAASASRPAWSGRPTRRPGRAASSA